MLFGGGCAVVTDLELALVLGRGQVPLRLAACRQTCLLQVIVSPLNPAWSRREGFAPEESAPCADSDDRSPYALPIWSERGRLAAHSLPSWNQIGAWLSDLSQLRRELHSGPSRNQERPVFV